jgi:hypothetical protein
MADILVPENQSIKQEQVLSGALFLTFIPLVRTLEEIKI